MKPYIFMARNGIYILDLQKTQRLIDEACKMASKIAASGEEILFVGTKRQARDIIEDEAKRGGCPYVTYRWLGGMLTNYATIRRSIKSLETYDRMAVDGTFDKLIKKEQLSINKARQKLSKTLGGIREMKRLPGALFVVDTRREAIAIAEARKLEIPIIAIVDTNTNPDLVDYCIPANDDAFKSIWLITHAVTDAYLEGKRRFDDKLAETSEGVVAPEGEKPKAPRKARRRRRPRRRKDSRDSKTQESTK